jgi:hypothetical protein
MPPHTFGSLGCTPGDPPDSFGTVLELSHLMHHSMTKAQATQRRRAQAQLHPSCEVPQAPQSGTNSAPIFIRRPQQPRSLSMTPDCPRFTLYG